jgi:DNA invertase Pin-like site-specific DNA recombinase
MLVGYARTSTADQTAGLDAQIRELKAAGCTKMFSERVSSVAQRPALAECLRFLREGDTLICTKPDRLARNTAELLKLEADLSVRGVGLVIQSMNLDTRNGSNPTARLMLTILAGVATWEREIMLERQREGIAKAKAEGRYKGRPSSIDRTRVRELLARMSRSRSRPSRWSIRPGIAGADEPHRSGQDAGDREVVGVPADLLTASVAMAAAAP